MGNNIGRKSAARMARGRASRLRGLSAETLAVWYLRCKGYRILARNWRSPQGAHQGEIDIVARRGKIVVLVEVKSRADEGAAGEALLAAQKRRLERAFRSFLQIRPELAALDARCDVIAMGRLGWPSHIKDAWRPEPQ
jgi:putative endonuclease